MAFQAIGDQLLKVLLRKVVHVNNVHVPEESGIDILMETVAKSRRHNELLPIIIVSNEINKLKHLNFGYHVDQLHFGGAFAIKDAFEIEPVPEEFQRYADAAPLHRFAGCEVVHEKDAASAQSRPVDALSAPIQAGHDGILQR